MRPNFTMAAFVTVIFIAIVVFLFGYQRGGFTISHTQKPVDDSYPDQGHIFEGETR